jgi:Zinc knuckle
MQRRIALPIQAPAKGLRREWASVIGAFKAYIQDVLISDPLCLFRCGSSQHTLSKCRKPVDKANSLPFASCFICKGTGHLASACPQNDKGVYPNGGCCKLCSKTDHLARNCPLRSKGARKFHYHDLCLTLMAFLVLRASRGDPFQCCHNRSRC